MTVTTYGAGGEGTNAWTNPSNARGTSADDTGGVARNCYCVPAYVSADTYWCMCVSILNGTLENCFFDSTYSTHSYYGTAKTSAELKKLATFAPAFSIANG